MDDVSYPSPSSASSYLTTPAISAVPEEMFSSGDICRTRGNVFQFVVNFRNGTGRIGYIILDIGDVTLNIGDISLHVCNTAFNSRDVALDSRNTINIGINQRLHGVSRSFQVADIDSFR